jgi:hypothetical protein
LQLVAARARRSCLATVVTLDTQAAAA